MSPDAALALSAGELALTTHTGLRLEVRRLRVRQFNGRVMVHVRFTDGSGVRLRIARGRVRELQDLLTAAVNPSDPEPMGHDHV